MDYLKIDGAYGEGGGQIIRSSVTLSCITKKPIHIENIRKNRKVPGLRPQHLMGIKILSKICNAKVDGLKIGSTSIRFRPAELENFSLKENVGTAGSIPLILQALIPAVSFSKKNLNLSIKGGTDVPWSPTSNYTKWVLAEAFSRMGVKFSVNVKRRGYYPRGGGLIELKVCPAQKNKPIELRGRKSKYSKIFCSISKLQTQSILEEISNAKGLLEHEGFSVKDEIIEESALNSGGSFLIYSQDSSSIIGYDCLIDKNSKNITNLVRNFIENKAGVDCHLSDMLVIPASMIDGLSVYRVNKITKHLETNLYVTSKITGCKYGINKIDRGFEIRIIGKSNP